MIVYSVHCDDCGAFIASSRLSVRGARAEAQIKCGANKGPNCDRCMACRKAEIRRQTDEMLERGTPRSHST